MKTKEERERLKNELQGLLIPGIKSLDDLKKVGGRGAEILAELIDDDILKTVTLFKDRIETYVSPAGEEEPSNEKPIEKRIENVGEEFFIWVEKYWAFEKKMNKALHDED